MRIKILPTAWDDLKQIEDYYLMEFGVETALRVSDNILNYIERLESFPDTGAPTPDPWLNEQGYKMVICEQHIAIYRIVREELYVYHIADICTDYTRLFKR